MKSKKQLIEMGFIFTTNSENLISVRLLDDKMNKLFSLKAKSMTTIKRKINQYLNN